jgi:hypothetical protein
MDGTVFSVRNTASRSRAMDLDVGITNGLKTLKAISSVLHNRGTLRYTCRAPLGLPGSEGPFAATGEIVSSMQTAIDALSTKGRHHVCSISHEKDTPF